MIIVGPKWGTVARHDWTDESGLGVIHRIVLKGASKLIQVIGTYWPIPHNESTTDKSFSLSAKLRRRLKIIRTVHIEPLDWIQGKIASMVAKHACNHGGGVSFVLGDFNATWSDNEKGGSNRGLSDWANKLGLRNDFWKVNSSQGMGICSNFSGAVPISLIDHFLTSAGIKLNAIGTSLNEEYSVVSDSHRPIWASFSVAGGRGSLNKIIKGRSPPEAAMAIQINRRDKKEVALFSKEIDVVAFTWKTEER